MTSAPVWTLMLCAGGVFLLQYGPVMAAVQTDARSYQRGVVALKSVLGDMLEEDLRTFDLKGLISKGLFCQACTFITEILNRKRSTLKLNRKGMGSLLRVACKTLDTINIITDKECQGLVNIYEDTIFYILKSANDTRTICPVILHQYNCKNVALPTFSININLDAPKPKRPSTYQENQVAPMRILQITDVHYDPYYQVGSNANCKEHLCCMASSGRVNQVVDRAGFWTDYRGCDIPDYFVRSAFKRIAKDKFDYIYFTGDIINHKLWATTPGRNLRDIGNFWQMFKRKFHGYSVFPILGNHEPHPCNMYPPPYLKNSSFSMQWLFDATAEHWRDFLPEEALVTVRHGGFYSVSPRPGFRVIAINSNIGYFFNFWIALDYQDPYGQLQWLADELQKAETNGEVVHILSHVTAGYEMVDSWGENLQKIIRRYANCIGAIFNGHTHIDELSLYYSEQGEPITVAFNGGSLTPYSDVNPNYKIYDVDPTSFDVLDYQTIAINLTEANMNVTTAPIWSKVYTFTEAYELEGSTPSDVHHFLERLLLEPNLRKRYFANLVRYGTPMMQKGCDKECESTILCNIVNTVNANTTRCDDLKARMVSG